MWVIVSTYVAEDFNKVQSNCEISCSTCNTSICCIMKRKWETKGQAHKLQEVGEVNERAADMITGKVHNAPWRNSR